MTEKNRASVQSDESPDIKEISLVDIMGWLLAIVVVFSITSLFRDITGRSQEIDTALTQTAISMNNIPPPLTPEQPASVQTVTPAPIRPLPIEIEDAYGVDMILIPAGRFFMGSDNGANNERPVHSVYLGDYYIDKYEVTRELYKACIDAGVCEPILYLTSDKHPISDVDWETARVFCEDWRGAHLPTEAEWEKAARGTEEREFPWGDEFSGFHANFCDRNCFFPWADKSINDGYAETSPVGSYSSGASVYGIYDMAGNVWEWVADWYSPYYYSSLSSYTYQPPGPETGYRHVIRGGAWNSPAYDLRVSRRKSAGITDAYQTIGFRCAQYVGNVTR